MQELTRAQVVELQQALLNLKEDLEHLLDATRDDVKPVAPDVSIGRLTRMDAIQQKEMAQAGRAEADLRLRQVLQALQLVERDEYGLCRRCEDPIGYKRLQVRPESPYCLDCQDEIDRKHGR